MNKLLALARTKLGCGYAWGCQGEILTPQLLNTLKNKYGAQHYELGNGVSASKWIGSQVFDCSGLIVWCLNELGFIAAGQDYTTEMLYHQLCTPIDRGGLQPGDLIFISANGIEHVGIYQGNGKTVEAKETASGVVEGNASRFDLFGKLKFNIGDDTMDWKQIIGLVSDSPAAWEKGIDTAVVAAKANGNLGDLEIFKYLPELVVKVYNAKK